jgi:hypothetical protein
MKQMVRIIEMVERVTEAELDFPLYLAQADDAGGCRVYRYESPHRRIRITSGPGLIFYGWVSGSSFSVAYRSTARGIEAA